MGKKLTGQAGTFANERLVDRIKVMAGDPMTDERVKKKIMTVLGSWYRQFKDDPSMRLVAGLYHACGGGKKAPQQQPRPTRTAADDAYESQMARYEREAAERAERKAREKREKEAQKEAERARLKASKNKPQQQQRRKFNFEQEKPNIMARVGAATQSAQALINALQHVNRETESVTTNERVQTCLAKVKNDRKYIVRYIQLVDSDKEGDYIGMLIHTNEQILSALGLYDRMSKPIDLDSDDEEVQKAKDASRAAGLNVPENDSNDVQSIRSRLSAFDLNDNEMDKLQRRQRERVEAVNRRRQQQVHPDLQDLAFGSSASAYVLLLLPHNCKDRTLTYRVMIHRSLPAPIAPRSAEDTYRHGSLSDYSDYDDDDYLSSDGEIVDSRNPPPTSASSSAGGHLPNATARSYARYVQSDPHSAAQGSSLLSSSGTAAAADEEEGEDDDDDPFGDENEAEAAGYEQIATPGINDKKRMEWAAV